MKIMDTVVTCDGHQGKIGEFDRIDGEKWVKVNLSDVISFPDQKGVAKKWYKESELRLA